MWVDLVQDFQVLQRGGHQGSHRGRLRKALLVAACALVVITWGPGTGGVRAEEEFSPPQYMLVVDEQGGHIWSTGHVLRPGDEILASDNRRYRVVRTDKTRAVARLVGEEDLGSLLTPEDEAAIARLLGEARPGARPSFWAHTWRNTIRGTGRLVPAVAVAAAAPAKVVGLYHTHSDESYEPNQGTASVEGKGGVFAVGASLASRLKEKGITPIHDMNVYLPHDGRAYERSRRGAAALAASRPLAILDVHRDSGPAQDYLRNIAGQLTSQVTIVVGRQNPQASANGSFAERLKAAADRMYPGLVRGILYTSGKFNQDVHPRNILIEVGTEKVTQEQAQRGASLLADAIPVAAGMAGPAVGAGREAAGALRALWWILGLGGLLGGAYLWLSSGSWEEARHRLQRWLNEVTLRGGRGNDRR